MLIPAYCDALHHLEWSLQMRGDDPLLRVDVQLLDA